MGSYSVSLNNEFEYVGHFTANILCLGKPMSSQIPLLFLLYPYIDSYARWPTFTYIGNWIDWNIYVFPRLWRVCCKPLHINSQYISVTHNCPTMYFCNEIARKRCEFCYCLAKLLGVSYFSLTIILYLIIDCCHIQSLQDMLQNTESHVFWRKHTKNLLPETTLALLINT